MRRRVLAFLCGLFIAPILFGAAGSVFANDEVKKLQAEIAEKNTRLADIEKEIAQYESALNEVGAEKKTLQSAIYQLDLERKKVLADIDYTQNRITSTDLQINKLTLEINNTERDIDKNKAAIEEIMRQMNSSDNDSMIEMFLRSDNISEAWNEFEALETVKNSMRGRVGELADLKVTLENQKSKNTTQREELVELKNQYSDQNSVLTNNKADKAELLSATQNEEANYQALLRDKEAARDLLMQEVQDIESRLQFILDPNTIPTAGTAVFRWPINPPIHITQYFGYTKFALSGAYNGNAHNGMDLGIPVGTKIYAPLSGTVRFVGNTDLVPGCYSWGKWVLIDHPNGLSSMFAHLSQPAVSAGQKVNTGDVVAYSGNTGYSTGPHLHYTVYVKDAVKVMRFSEFKATTGCGAAYSPFAAVEGYVDPLDYLPSL